MKKGYAPLVLRVGLGGLFLTTGILKLIAPEKTSGMLANLGFPVPLFWAWILIVVEVLCGAALVAGWKVRLMSLPLMIILIVALFLGIGSFVDWLKNVALLFSLVSLWMLGPGAVAIGRKRRRRKR